MSDAPKITATISEAAQRFQDTGSISRFYADVSGAFLSVLDDNRVAALRSVGAVCRSEPDHITSVTVALGCALHLEIKGGHRADSEHFALTLHAGPGTAIGVPTVAVDSLRAAGLVL